MHLRNSQFIIRNSQFAILHSHFQGRRAPLAPAPNQPNFPNALTFFYASVGFPVTFSVTLAASLPPTGASGSNPVT